MLYPYKYPKVEILKFNSFINYVMLEVVLKAKHFRQKKFSIKLIKPQKYVDIINEVNKRYIRSHISNMYSLCKKMDSKHIKILRKAVLENNRIEELCNGNLHPIRYSDLFNMFTKPTEIKMVEEIKAFCNSLYEDCLRLAPIIKRFGELKDFDETVVGNDRRCRFCGGSNLSTQYNSHKNDFDHYLPKSVYPFISVNFRNIVPVCKQCNESYKRTNDILYENGHRRKVFYPYTLNKYEIKVHVDLKVAYNKNLKPDDIDISCTCENYQEETDSWFNIYGIEERYKDVCLDIENMSFLADIVDDINGKGTSFKEEIHRLEYNRQFNMNFVKIPFYESALKTLGFKI